MWTVKGFLRKTPLNPLKFVFVLQMLKCIVNYPLYYISQTIYVKFRFMAIILKHFIASISILFAYRFLTLSSSMPRFNSIQQTALKIKCLLRKKKEKCRHCRSQKSDMIWLHQCCPHSTMQCTHAVSNQPSACSGTLTFLPFNFARSNWQLIPTVCKKTLTTSLTIISLNRTARLVLQKDV